MTAGTSPTSGRIVADTLRPTRPRRSTASERVDLGRRSTGGPTAWPRILLDRGVDQQDKVAHYLYNCPSTSRRSSPPSRPGSCRSTPTTATPTTSSSTCGTTPTPSRSCSTARSPSASSASATACPKVQALAVGRRRQRPVPRLGRRPTRRPRRRATGRVPAPVGPQRRRPLLLYTGGTTGMPKGVMWRQDDLVRAASTPATPHAVSGASPTTTRVRADGRPSPGRRHACRPARSCTAPACSPPSSACWPAAARSCTLDGRTLRRRRAARHRRARAGQHRCRSSATPSPSRSSRALDAEPGRWDLSSLARDRLVGRDVERGRPSRACSRHNPRHDAGRRVLARRRRSAWARRCRPAGDAAHDGQVHARRRTRGCSTTTAATSCRARARAAGSALAGPHAGRLLQGPGEVGGHVPGDRRRALLDPRRLRHGRGRRHHHACSAAARCASTPAARRSSPRRSRRSLKTHPTVRDAVVVGVPDDRFGEAITAVVEPRPAPRVDEADADRPREEPPGRASRPRSGCSSSTRSAGPRTARSTTSASRPRPSTA